MNTPRFVSLQRAAIFLGALMVITAATLSQAQTQTLPDKPVVTGTFLGDGKDGKIQHLIVLAREPFNDKPAIQLIFTEKNPAASKKPDFDAGFKRLGSALLISVFHDGQIFGCEVAHTAHEKSPFSAIGEIKAQDLKVTDTHISGRISTGGELDAFGQKWNVDLTFSAPLPKGAFAAAVAEPAPESKSKMAAKEKGQDTPPAGPAPSVADIPLPSTAVDVEYKSVVGHIAFRSDAPVSAVAADFSARLKAKGWKEMPGGLMGKTNAILKRQLNDADLMIMVQPAGKGCTVKVFTEGLDWSNPPASAASKATPAKAGNGVGIDGIEAEANRLLNDALKQIPGGLK